MNCKYCYNQTYNTNGVCDEHLNSCGTVGVDWSDKVAVADQEYSLRRLVGLQSCIVTDAHVCHPLCGCTESIIYPHPPINFSYTLPNVPNELVVNGITYVKK